MEAFFLIGLFFGLIVLFAPAPASEPAREVIIVKEVPHAPSLGCMPIVFLAALFVIAAVVMGTLGA